MTDNRASRGIEALDLAFGTGWHTMVDFDTLDETLDDVPFIVLERIAGTAADGMRKVETALHRAGKSFNAIELGLYAMSDNNFDHRALNGAWLEKIGARMGD